MNDQVMTTDHPADAPMTGGEWDLRVKLAAAYRLVDY